MPLCQALNKTNAFNLFISPVQIAESELGTENYKNHETSRRLVNSSDSNITPRKNKTLVMTQPEEDTRSLPAVTIHSVILALSAILALMGNSLVCLAFYRNRRLRTVTDVYVLSLAVADRYNGIHFRTSFLDGRFWLSSMAVQFCLLPIQWSCC